MSPTTVYKSAAGIIFLAIVGAIVSAYLSGCDQLTGAAKISIQAKK